MYKSKYYGNVTSAEVFEFNSRHDKNQPCADKTSTEGEAGVWLSQGDHLKTPTKQYFFWSKKQLLDLEICFSFLIFSAFT